MFIKVTKNSYNQSYYHLVETYREKGKVKQRTLLSLGKVGEDRLDELASAISKHKEVFTVLELAKNISVDKAYIYGPLLVLKRLIEKSGIEDILKLIANKHLRLGFDLYKIVFTMIAMRFVSASSKLKIYEYWQKRLYFPMIEKELRLHQIYRAMDILAGNKEDIEKGLFWHGRDLFEMQVDVVLYDLTTLRFESMRTDLGRLRQFGYSKEMRADCTQVVFGLMVTPEGMPLGFEVYPGNTFEGSTINDIVMKLSKKFNIWRFIFIGDRGLFSKKNLDEIRGDKKVGEFIIGMKLGIFKERHKEFYNISRYTWVDDDLAFYETTHDGDRCIITWSRVRAERDRKTREDIIGKIRKKLAKKKVTAKTFVSNTTYRKYVIGLNHGKGFAINEDAIFEDAVRDGYFGIITNVKDISARDIVMNYKTLWIIEDAFGEIKGNLKARPVFHWTDQRIIGHLTLCFLAYYCEALMTKYLREKNIMLESPAIDDGTIKERPLTVFEAMRELKEVRAIPIQIRGTTIWVRTDISGNAYKLFSTIGLKIPPKIITCTKNQKCSGTN